MLVNNNKYMKEEILELDYHKMVREIDKLINSDFVFDMECKLLPNFKKYTQQEAIEMAELLANIYSISHIDHCKACRTIKYAKKHIV